MGDEVPVGSKWPKEFPVGSGSDSGDTMWVKMVVWKINEQNLNANDAQAINVTRKGEMLMLPTNEIAENINHNWEEYSSVAGRLGQKLAQYGKLKHETANLVEGAGAGFSSAKAGGGFTGVTAAAQAAATAEIHKSDAPLVYKDSSRREYSFTFIFADQGNPGYDVMAPVNYLRQFSCANFKDKLQIEFPYIFSVDTISGNGAIIPVVNIKYAALRSVQPTFGGPYRGGIPSRCDCQVTFMDIEPLYKTTWETGSSKVTAVARGLETQAQADDRALTNWLDEGYGN